jgi:uncharacterized protein (TIGR02246 family)
MIRALILTATMTWGLTSVQAAKAEEQAADVALIREAVKSYVAAFNRGDAKALAALWSPEAVYTNPVSNEQVVGRDAIERQFSTVFGEAQGIKLEANTDSIQFVSPNIAIEHGTATVDREGQKPENSEYTAVYVKRDGYWLLDRVTEEDVVVAPSHYEQLKELEWMIGTWVDQDDKARIETTCEWTKNQNFITRSFVLSVRDRIEMAGMQFIGWDPVAKQVRSWVFDSDGGFSQGTWSKKDNSWHIHSFGTLPDGTKSSSVNIITYVDDNTFTWQSLNREAGGELLPNVDEVVVVRQTEQQ